MFVEVGSVSFEVEDGRERGFDVTIHVSPANENINNVRSAMEIFMKLYRKWEMCKYPCLP